MIVLKRLLFSSDVCWLIAGISDMPVRGVAEVIGFASGLVAIVLLLRRL